MSVPDNGAWVKLRVWLARRLAPGPRYRVVEFTMYRPENRNPPVSESSE